MERHCSFSVFSDKTGPPIHTESAVLTEHLREKSSESLYGVSLVPSLWKSLCESTTPTRFTIVQSLYIASPTASSDSKEHARISVVYNFTYPESSTELLPVVPARNRSGFFFMNDPIPERNWNTGLWTMTLIIPAGTERLYGGRCWLVTAFFSRSDGRVHLTGRGIMGESKTMRHYYSFPWPPLRRLLRWFGILGTNTSSTCPGTCQLVNSWYYMPSLPWYSLNIHVLVFQVYLQESATAKRRV